MPFRAEGIRGQSTPFTWTTVRGEGGKGTYSTLLKSLEADPEAEHTCPALGKSERLSDYL